ncbi:MAG: sodium:solute symporter [Algoriphagus sp.]|jgi:Na+/proline symporter|uniref:sodium:solute symporter n=1 Tax=Algoriphagus sp. TaxID=1872435 RepID=UPI00276F28AD|nr:sodium:solute symporter [Algoriphagus sp.]MDP4746989.1 sodium:solute symporter [Algoriphagus sp.]MDP4903590.1 sodium:solute symporter [Algoriphagus sp.]MDP4956274.1 sodium:solute symporter [Algoriphagus sp.]MDP5125496.1 sodium:solute symporter [Algoriphagus sp.]
MNPQLVFTVISIYFGLLFFISWLTSRKLTGDTFFTGDRNSHWFLVSFGMIGASLSGVTFISVPGEVGNSNFYYFQVVLGYTLGYLTIAKVLLPLYYRLNLVSIYTFLENRFGFWSYKTGAFFFILSRSLGSSLRLYLVASVLQLILFDALGIPFWVSVLLTVALIWLYTFRGGIKTVVWTDTLQTAFMLTAVLVTLVLIGKELEISSLGDYVNTLVKDQRSTLFNWDWKAGTNFFKQFISGAFITIVMTGLDQDMMQKNLTCRTLGDAQKNMFWFTGILVVVNLLFLSLGVMLYLYAETKGIPIPERSDSLFPLLASTYFSPVAGIIFVLGIIAAAYSSVDSTLTALTTSFCYDFLQIDRNYPVEKRVAIRKQVHIGFTAFLYVLILAFYWLNDQSVINSVFILAGYTYGPLLGLFGFGLFTNYQVKDVWVPSLAILAPSLTFLIASNSQEWLWGYTFGFEALVLNGALMFTGLYLLRKKV